MLLLRISNIDKFKKTQLYINDVDNPGSVQSELDLADHLVKFLLAFRYIYTGFGIFVLLLYGSYPILESYKRQRILKTLLAVFGDRPALLYLEQQNFKNSMLLNNRVPVKILKKGVNAAVAAGKMMKVANLGSTSITNNGSSEAHNVVDIDTQKSDGANRNDADNTTNSTKIVPKDDESSEFGAGAPESNASDDPFADIANDGNENTEQKGGESPSLKLLPTLETSRNRYSPSVSSTTKPVPQYKDPRERLDLAAAGLELKTQQDLRAFSTVVKLTGSLFMGNFGVRYSSAFMVCNLALIIGCTGILAMSLHLAPSLDDGLGTSTVAPTTNLDEEGTTMPLLYDRFPIYYPVIAEILVFFIIASFVCAVTVFYGMQVNNDFARVTQILHRSCMRYEEDSSTGDSPISGSKCNDHGSKRNDLASSSNGKIASGENVSTGEQVTTDSESAESRGDFIELANEISTELSCHNDLYPVKFVYLPVSGELFSLIYGLLTTLIAVIVHAFYTKGMLNLGGTMPAR